MTASQGSELLAAGAAPRLGVPLDGRSDGSFEAPLVRRSGLRWWLHGYVMMVQWYAVTLRTVLPIILIIQVLFGAGTVIGFGLLLPEVPPGLALYFATGGTVVVMTTIGFVLVPSSVAEAKALGWYDFLWSLPVPRMVIMFAAMTVYVVVAIPGMGIALGVAELRYDIDLAISLQVIPLALLVLLTSTSIGFSIGHLSPSPILTNAITNILIFVVFLYSPVNYPAERLPGWIQSIHDWLPFEHSANAMRASLTETLGDDLGRSVMVLTAWAAVSLIATYWVLERRR
jgi:ABC-2 type transport system permease protein